jgi:hypothetical protein
VYSFSIENYPDELARDNVLRFSIQDPLYSIISTTDNIEAAVQACIAISELTRTADNAQIMCSEGNGRRLIEALVELSNRKMKEKRIQLECLRALLALIQAPLNILGTTIFVFRVKRASWLRSNSVDFKCDSSVSFVLILAPMRGYDSVHITVDRIRKYLLDLTKTNKLQPECDRTSWPGEWGKGT